MSKSKFIVGTYDAEFSHSYLAALRAARKRLMDTGSDYVTITEFRDGMYHRFVRVRLNKTTGTLETTRKAKGVDSQLW